MTESGSSSDPGLDELVAEGLARLERDGSAGLDALCAEHPARADRLRRRLELLAGAGLVDAVAEAPRPGQVLGDYALGELLGEGAMGRVYRASDRRTGREVAVKVVRPELLSFADARARFDREVQLASRLEHPGLVSILAVGEQAGAPWFASELVRGAGLGACIAALRERFGRADDVEPAALAEVVDTQAAATDTGATGAPPEHATWFALALDIAIQLARALAAAHAGGVLHRDVKPSNALVRRDGSVVLADLGLAVEVDESSLTRTGTVVGSLPYTAPEVLDGVRCDARADVYSLGATLQELWTLERAFRGANTAELTRRIAEGDRVDPRRLARLSADAVAVLDRALAPRPDDRYPTVDALARDLEALRDGRPTQARPLGASARAWRALRRRPATALAGLLAIGVAIGGPLGYGAVQAAERRATERSALELEELNQELSAALASERVERARADANLARTVGAVETLLSQASDSLIGDVPFTQELNAELMREALAIVDELRASGDAGQLDPEFVARVEYAAAGALLELSLMEEAEATAARGLEALRRLEPLERDRLAGLEHSLARRRAFAVRGREPQRALELYREAVVDEDRPAIRVFDRLEVRFELLTLERELGVADGSAAQMGALIDAAREHVAGHEAGTAELASAREQLCRFLIHRGTQTYKAGDLDLAAEQLGEGLALATEIADEEPRRIALRASAVVARTNVVAALAEAKRPEEARAELEVGIEEARLLSESFPSSTNYASYYVGMLVNQGLLASQVGAAQEALESWERAIEIARPYVDGEHAPLNMLRHVAQASMNAASVARDRGESGLAVERAEEALGFYERAAELAPGDSLVRRGLVVPRVLMAFEHMAAGELDDAGAKLDAAVAAEPLDGGTWRMLVELDLTLVDALEARGDADARVEELRARACASYARLLELGWINRRDWAENPRFEGVRDRPDWPDFPGSD